MSELQREEVLCIPKRRRLVHSTSKSPEGQEVLHVFYGDKELVFDEPDLVPFGNGLLGAEHFRAEEAMSWSNGTPHDWEKARGLLEALLEHEILKRVKDEGGSPNGKREFPATLGPPGIVREPRAFGTPADHCPVLTQEAFGRAIDLSNLEVVLPVYRIAHAALDLDGRQVGENNVAPRSLFLDLPTQRRECHYAGSRYLADTPMNITALRHMTRRWPELLSLTEQFRTAFLARFAPRRAALTAGELHVLTVCCLASVGYVLVRGVNPVENGQLDAGLAAMFRLIDGVRLVTTEWVRESADGSGCERLIDAQSIADYAEQSSLYHGSHGVCAGPQALIDEYLRVLLGEVKAPIQVEPDLAARLGELDAALDYGLLGQRIEALVRTLGARQGLLRQRLRGAFAASSGATGASTRLQALLDAPVDSEHYPLLRSSDSLEATFELEIAVSRWMFAHAAAGLSPARAVGTPSIDELLQLDGPVQMSQAHQLLQFLREGLAEFRALPAVAQDELAAVAADAFALQRRCLRAVEAEQRVLQQCLQRVAGRTLTDQDLALYTRPRAGPPLESLLCEGLGLAIRTDGVATVITQGTQRLSLRDGEPTCIRS
ncbi:MAG: hypothetical protein RL033_6603 [Pseudomonadota bacterium]